MFEHTHTPGIETWYFLPSNPGDSHVPLACITVHTVLKSNVSLRSIITIIHVLIIHIHNYNHKFASQGKGRKTQTNVYLLVSFWRKKNPKLILAQALLFTKVFLHNTILLHLLQLAFKDALKHKQPAKA